MKILCENCSAKYAISSDLLKKKITRFRCKKCQHIMSVGRDQPISANEAAAEARNQDLQDEFASALAEQEAFGDVGGELPDEKTSISTMASLQPNDQEQGLVLRSDIQAVENRIAAIAEEDVSTRVFNIGALQTLRAERKSALQSRQEQLREPQVQAPANDVIKDSQDTTSSRSQTEWYALLDDRQLGPLSLLEMQEKISLQEFDEQTYVWNESLPEWQLIGDVAGFLTVPGASGGFVLSPKAPAVPGVVKEGKAKAPLSFAPAPIPGQLGHDDLGHLVAKELMAIGTEASPPSSPAARLLGEPGPNASGFDANIAAIANVELGKHGVPSTLYPMPATTTAFASKNALFDADARGGQPGTRFYIGVLSGVIVLLLLGGGVGGYMLFQEMKQGQQVTSQRPTIPVPRVIAPPRALVPVARVVPKVRAVAAPKQVVVPMRIRPLPLRAKIRRRRRIRRRVRRRRVTRRAWPKPLVRNKAKSVVGFSQFMPPPPPPEPRTSKAKNTLNEKELQRLLGDKPGKR